MLARTGGPAHRILRRRLAATAEPAALFARLAPEPAPDTMFFQNPSGAAIAMTKAAVRIECRGEAVVCEALSTNGESLLRALGKACPDRVTSSAPTRLDLRYEQDRGADLEARLLGPAPLHAIRSVLKTGMKIGEDEFASLVLGIIAFDYAALGEDLVDNPEDPLGFPDYLFWVPESLVIFGRESAPLLVCAAFGDEQGEQAERNYHDAVSRLSDLSDRCRRASKNATAPHRNATPCEAMVDLDDSDYMRIVERLKAEIAAGEVYQIVPSRTFTMPCADPWAAFAALRAIEPCSYHFYASGADFTLFGASPETSVRTFNRDGCTMVEVRPIAGTRPRGGTPDEDNRLEAELRLDEKEVAEHMMLVDLARNDVGRISEPGTRHISELLKVERFAHVMHLVSSVIGRLREGLDAVDALAACLNVGTLTGAPKLRATQLLREVERTRRGPYGGAIGWLSATGEMDTAVVIRTAFVRDGLAHVRAGAGIVFDSDPRAEADETRRKASALLSILASASAEAEHG